jgi:hypothetical protein
MLSFAESDYSLESIGDKLLSTQCLTGFALLAARHSAQTILGVRLRMGAAIKITPYQLPEYRRLTLTTARYGRLQPNPVERTLQAEPAWVRLSIRRESRLRLRLVPSALTAFFAEVRNPFGDVGSGCFTSGRGD